MRKLTAGLFMTLDGVVESPDAWQGPYFDASMGERISTGITEADAVLIGTRTYLAFAELWTTQAQGPMADFMNKTTKYVVSSSLTDLTWENSVLLGGDLTESVTRLKAEPGRNIQVPGSPRLVRSLLAAGLLDELNLMIHPLVVGSGLRLFEDLPALSFELTGSNTYGTGVVSMTYRPISR